MIAHGGTVAGAPPVQVPPLLVSLVVQAWPSLQGAVLLTWTQPVEGLQVSSVQTLPSSQEGAGPPTHRPPLQATFVVHMLPSLQGAALLVCTQAVAWLQPSAVQGLPSSQVGGAPPTQFPPLQASLVVHALPSLQGAVLLVWTQPVARSQPSSVQPLPSLQFGAGPPTQRPPLQASLVVQALPSLHGAALLACAQPVDGLQVSSVQTVPSSQLARGSSDLCPPLQASLVVQALPSLQGGVLLACTQPVVALQLSSVQTLPSSQLGAGPPTHRPALQVSVSVHAFPSLQAALLLVWAQPVDGLQVSSVLSLPAAAVRAAPPVARP